ncbi:hypothetical protein L1887_00876 [Cichorium endivia]|nr:hypothetical protein L1887_00876 [Cichorium endivia]
MRVFGTAESRLTPWHALMRAMARLLEHCLQKRGLLSEEKQEKMLQISYDSQDFYLLKEVGKFGSRKRVTNQFVKDVVQTLVDDGFVSKDKIGTSLRNVSKKLESEVEISKKGHLEFVEQCDSLKKSREDSASW